LWRYKLNEVCDIGYKFKIIKGYTYENKIIFSNYIENLYKIRLQYSKDYTMNYIAKLFFNSLYSRFGMKDLFDKILLLDSKKYSKYTENINPRLCFINNIIKFNNNYLIQIEEKVKSNPNIQYSCLRQQSYFIVIGTENTTWLKFMLI